jgi:biotin transport system substrate-specific component
LSGSSTLRHLPVSLNVNMKGSIIQVIRRITSVSLFAALTAAGAYIVIPLPVSPVPLVLQSLFILTAGMVLGPCLGSLSAVLYLGVGALGLPVFAGGSGGIAHLAGPTGGYLLSFPLAAFTAGIISRWGKPSAVKYIMGGTAASLMIYAVGVPWLKWRTGLNWEGAFASGILPFLPGDAVKTAAASGIAKVAESWFSERRTS